MYADGGVMGVQISRLMTVATQDMGVLTTSEGKHADFGVWRGGRTGLVTAGMMDVDNERVKGQKAWMSQRVPTRNEGECACVEASKRGAPTDTSVMKGESCREE